MHAACGSEEEGSDLGITCPRQEDCVPLHPLLNGYMLLYASMLLKGSKGVLVMIHKKHSFLLVALAAVLLLISACSPIGGGSGGSNLTVLQLLQNSSKAMSQLKSTHIDLKANGSGQAITTNAASTPTSGTATATTTTIPVNNVTFNLI